MSKKIVSLIIFGVVCLIFLFYCLISFNNKENNAPTISIDTNVSKFSIKATNQDFLQGVSAFDTEDGDVTKSLVIENISNFTENNTRIITYVAFDSANNVSKLDREISYTDYKSPQITAKGDLIFDVGVKDSEILEKLSCYDIIDGDISDKIVIQINGLNRNKVGTQSVNFGITNSCGDTSYSTFDITIR